MPQTTLQILVIGGRLGESIIVRTPGGAFGVVDAYASDWTNPAKNPTLLRLKSLGAEHLSFIVMTHPHMDHFRGLPSIFEAYRGRIDSFWRAPWGAMDMWNAFEQECALEKSDARRERIVRQNKILRSLLDAAVNETRSSKMENFTLQNDSKAKHDGVLFQEEPHDFSIMCLGPSTKITNPYSNNIARKAAGQVSQGQLSGWKAPHNEISSVLAVRYGEWVGVLGGDTEQASWNDILHRRADLLNAASFFKVSHHGSPTGSFPTLWNCIKSVSCEAVVTCFAHQALPNEAGLKCVRNSGFRLHSTNQNLAESLYRGKRPAPMPVELSASNTPGEIMVTVDSHGQMQIDYSDPAGLMNV